MEVTVIYPHQLFSPEVHPALKTGRTVYLIEEPLFISEFGTHRQKMLLHRLSLQTYKKELAAAGFKVIYIELKNGVTTDGILKSIASSGITNLHVVDTTDNWLEQRLKKASVSYGFTLTRYESPLFLLTKEEAVERFKDSGKFMKKFYERLRRDTNILMDGDKPVGGKYSFDSDNRSKLPKNTVLPADIAWLDNEDTRAAKTWLKTIDSEQYGGDDVWVPYTRAAAKEFLTDFCASRFADFGQYEDAITTRHHRLFHSTLSPLINIGLLSPREVLDTALAYAETHTVPINSLEGFVRQILGWREFIRGSYEVEGSNQRQQNFFNHTRTLPATFWTATTGILPLDISITTALAYGYNHHIERLMVLGNFMLLTQTNPDHVYRWFMAMYVDAYDWVMVPNVYGMSQFADGGSFATKPYISGSSYLKKMSDYPPGYWEELWTALYWNFINTHSEFFSKNYRLSMMPKLLDKMSAEKKSTHLSLAEEFLNSK